MKPLEEIRRVKSNSDTESMVKLETAEVAQAGMKGYEMWGRCSIRQRNTCDNRTYLSECES